MDGVVFKALTGQQKHGIFIYIFPSEFKEFQKKCFMGLRLSGVAPGTCILLRSSVSLS